MASERNSVVASCGRALLIVDDDVDAAELLSFVLEPEGFDVRIALHGSAALLATEQFSPDVAIIDIELPDLSGYELVAKLREIPALQRCRYIAITAYVDDGMAGRSARAGFEAHLIKPISTVELVRILHGSERT